MGATESSYRKLGATVAKLQCVPRKRIEVDEADRVSDRKGKKRRRESLFANAQWSSSSSRRRGSDVSEWPAWYHGWCRCVSMKEKIFDKEVKTRRADVETLLKCGPDGLFLVKNSTEFPGDLTLCLFKVLKQINLFPTFNWSPFSTRTHTIQRLSRKFPFSIQLVTAI